MPKDSNPAQDKQQLNLQPFFSCFPLNFWKNRWVLLIRMHLSLSSSIPFIFLYCWCLFDEFWLPYRIPAILCCWKTFPSWTGSLSSVALDELTPELESTSLLVCWQGQKRKALAWGRKRAKELKCFSILLSPLGSEIDYYDILTFLNRYWSSYWSLVSCWGRDQKVKRSSCFQWEAGSWLFDAGCVKCMYSMLP